MQRKAHTGARLSIASVLLGTFLPVLVCPRVLASDLSLDLAQYAHATWTPREGLQGSTRSIVQTPDGYLWLGTEFGLVRFDGVRFVRWSPPAGQHLPSDNILALLAARDGTLWIGTLDGLASWKNGRLTRYPEVADTPVYTLFEDPAGSVWTGCSGKLCWISGSGIECYPVPSSESKAVPSSLYQNRGGVYSLYEDSEGGLWVGTQSGLWKWKPRPPRQYPEYHFFSSQALVRGDEPSGLMFTNGSALTQMAGNTFRAYTLSGVPRPLTPFKLLRDRNGALWIGTLEQGVLRVYQGRTTRFSRSDGLSGTTVTALFEDREGTVWVGTTNGIDRFHEPAISTITEKQGLSIPAFSVLPARDGAVWIGTRQGLNRWYEGRVTLYRSASAAANSGATAVPSATDGQADASGAVRVVTDPQLPDDQVESLFEDQRGRIWARTQNKGAVWFENGRFTPSRGICASANAMISDGHNGAWISCPDSGLFHVAGEKVIESLPWPRSSIGNDPRVTALLPDPVKGGLWVGFLRGGLQYLKDGRVAASIDSKDGLGFGPVWGLSIDHEGTLWAATEGGLSHVADGRAATLTTQNGLPCDAVHWVVEDNASSLWLSTSCGLLRISRSELSTWASGSRTIGITRFDSERVSMHVNLNRFNPIVCKSGDGRLWFAHLEGVSVIDPLHVELNEIPPPVHIEQITADGKRYPATPGTLLPARVRDLRIDYTALSLVAPEKVRFKYKLEGQDHDWKEVINDRQAQYTNLPPSHYRFRVTACNNSGVWNESGDTLEFSVAPAYYQTNWFRLLAAVALLTAIWSIYCVRVRMLERRNSEVRALNEALRESEGYLRETQVQTHTGSWALDIASGVHKYVYWSEEMFRILGFDPQQGPPTREKVIQRILPEDRKRVEQNFEKSLREKVDTFDEYRAVLPDGTVEHLHIIRHPLLNGAGDVVKFVGTSIDVTERKRAEEALRLSNAYNRSLIEASVDPLVTIGPDGTITDVNAATEAATGRSRRELIGTDFSDYFTEPAKARAGYQQVFREGTVRDYPLELRHRDGRVMSVLYNASIYRDESGQVIGVFAAARDITEREATEEALRESETRFRTFVDHAADAFFMLDFEQGTILDVNRCACESLGYTRDELIGRTPLTFDVNLDRPTFDSMAERTAAGETVLFDRHWHRRKDGSLFPVEVHTSVFWHAGRRLLLKVARDISDRMRAEEQRERLRQLEAELAHINRVSMMGELGASIAHEINQPLAGVVSNGSACLRWLARDPPDVDEAREAARRIVGAGQHAGEIIKHIRALTTRAAAAREKLNLNETIREVLALVSDEAKRKSVMIRAQFADDLSPVSGDRVQLQQVVLNLAMNAIEAMSSTSDQARKLVISTGNVDGDQVQVTVEDSGPGLEPNAMGKIFESFYSTKPGGMGMGLSISRSIVRAHGGRLWATAGNGRGTMFHFALPKYHGEQSNGGE